MNDYLGKVKEILAERTGVDPDEVTDEAYFHEDLNIGKIELMEVIAELEEEYEITLEDEEKEDIESVGDLVGLLIEYVE